ncbi:SIMPL domain-containing protein [Nocardioides caeni]|uniref:SIMPL domain-containing protein n=1 Tax=Nocardioides caeni TaxID=574700 RepID=A0A4S8ND78_9ACTN|nr:SIMPL domain-containing protein [Nocardioides caeni]THV14537.1 SIMPL domain-containing protein [Nocardioides caeni]
MATEFVVRGSHRVFHAPERATVRVTLALEGPALQPVYDRVVRDVESVRSSIGALHDPERGPVTWWATGNVRTWAQRPWNQDGKQLPLVHHASVGVEAKFRDFAALSRWVGQQVASTQGFSLDGVVWALTEQNRLQLERAVRTRAVRNAAQRAQEYADALGLGVVRPVAIADSGMLGQGLSPMGDSAAPFARMAAAGKQGGGELELSPEDIEVSAEVDARFQAD